VFKGFDERYLLDKRRTDRESYDWRIRQLIRKAFQRFSNSAGRRYGSRKGLFAACLYIEGMLQCFDDIRFRAEVLGVFNEERKGGKLIVQLLGSQDLRRWIRPKLVRPKRLEKWSAAFRLGSKKTIVKRLQEIEQETRYVPEKILFVKRF